MQEDYGNDAYKDSYFVDYFVDTNRHFDFSTIQQPFTIYINVEGGTIEFGKEIIIKGFDDANEATLAFLNKLKEIYPEWIRSIRRNEPSE